MPYRRIGRTSNHRLSKASPAFSWLLRTPVISSLPAVPVLRPYCLWMINKGEIEKLKDLFELDYVEDPMNTVGDRATVDLVLPDLKQIKQLLPIFNKKYQQYIGKMDFLNKEEVQELLNLR